MSTISVTINNSYTPVKIPNITLGRDTLVINVGSGFETCTHYRVYIYDVKSNTAVYKPSYDGYTTQTSFIYTPDDLANTTFLDNWGGGLVVSLIGYQQRTMGGKTYYNDEGRGEADGTLQVDLSRYHPTLSLGDITITNAYNNLALAGVSKVSTKVTVGHLNSYDKADIQTVKVHLSSSGLVNTIPITLDDTTATSTDVIPTSNEQYYLRFAGYAMDSRYVYHNGSLIPGNYIQTNQILVYPYALPTYDSKFTYVNRCDAAGKADGGGAYVRIHLDFDISVIDGTNALVNLTTYLNSTEVTPLNDNYRTDGYADYICEIATSEEATVRCTLTDNTGLSNTFTLKVPMATVPLSLFDDGINKGTAFGQMATKIGNWFYGNLVMVKNNIPYILDIDSTLSLTARRLYGDTGVRSVFNTFEINTNRGSNLYPSEFNNDIEIRTVNSVTTDAEATLVYSGKGSKIETSLSTPVGTLLYIRNFPTGTSGVDFVITVNGTVVVKNNVIQDTPYEVSWEEDSTPTTIFTKRIWVIRVPDSGIDVCFHAYDFEMGSQSWGDIRKTYEVVAQNSSYYSFWDEDNLHHSTNNRLTLYSLEGAPVFKLFQESADKSIDYWLVNGVKYYTENLVTPGLDSSQTITAVYKAKISIINVVVTYKYLSSSGLLASFTLTNLDTSEVLVSVDWSSTTPSSSAVKVKENTRLQLYFYTVEETYPYLIINGTTYKGSNHVITQEVQVTSTLSVTVA